MADERLTFTIAAIDKTKAAFSAIKGRIGSLQAAIAGLAIGAGLKKFAGEIDNLAKSSSKLGLTVNQLQSLQFAGELTGVSADKLTQGLARFSKGISETAAGTGIAKKSFEDLGISVSDNEGNIKSTEQLLGEVSDKMAQVGSSADRVRIANDLFGRSGVDLINTLSGGSEALNDMRNEFNQLTFELTGEQAKAVETANDNFSRIGTVFSSIGKQVTAYVLPILAKFALFLVTNFLKSVNAAIGAAQWMQKTFASVYNSIAKAIGAAEMVIKEFGDETRKDLTKTISALEAMVDPAGKVAEKTRLQIPIIKENKEELAKLNDEWDRQNGGLLVAMDNLDDFRRGADLTKTNLQEFADSAGTLHDALQNGSVNMLESFEDAFIGIVQGTTSAKDAFKSMANSIISDIARMVIRQQITAPIAGAMNNFLGGIFKADGGPVMGSTPYIVGERGPELFVPGTSGRIVPNNAMSSVQGGGQTTIVNQTIQIETGVSQTVRAEILNLLPQIKEQTKAAVLDSRLRGGQFAAAFR
ncbi:MAG: phage tail tape measure C-terminal domain-containing protein [Pelagibacteraceae bacterium]